MKWLTYIIVAALCVLFTTNICWGSDSVQKEYDLLMDELFSDGAIDDAINQVLKNDRISIRQLITKLMSGESTVIDVIKELINSEVIGFGRYKQILIKLLGIIILCALFGFLPQIFGSEQSSQMGHFVSFIMLTAFLLTIFKDAVSIVNESIEIILFLMNIILPVYLIAVALAGGVTTAGISYEMFVGILYLVQKVIQRVAGSAIMIYIITGFSNQLLENDSFSKLTELIRKIISKGLKAIVSVLTGFQLLQGLITPYIDKFNTSFTGKAIEAIPGIGDIATSGIEMAIGAALVVKNTMGVVLVIFLIAVGIAPLAELMGYAVVLIFVNTLLQPILQKRVQNILDIAVSAIKLLIQTLLTVILMFVISIALLAAKSGGGL